MNYIVEHCAQDVLVREKIVKSLKAYFNQLQHLGEWILMRHKAYGALGPLGFSMTEKQARNLDILLKQLPKSKEFKYKKTSQARDPDHLRPRRRRRSKEGLWRLGACRPPRNSRNTSAPTGPRERTHDRIALTPLAIYSARVTLEAIRIKVAFAPPTCLVKEILP